MYGVGSGGAGRRRRGGGPERDEGVADDGGREGGAGRSNRDGPGRDSKGVVRELERVTSVEEVEATERGCAEEETRER